MDREEDYKELNPADVAYYDGCGLCRLKYRKTNDRPSIPPKQCTYEIDELNANLQRHPSHV